MDNLTKEESCYIKNEYGDPSVYHLSPIKEIEENSVFENTMLEDEVMGLVSTLRGDELKTHVIPTELALDTSYINCNERLPVKPVTPPEILRHRLNLLQTDYEELKEFTMFEKQIYHSDCIPKEKVISLEEEFALLKEKAQDLMEENVNYKNKLELNEDEKKKLEIQLDSTLNFQTEVLAAVGQMIVPLAEIVKVHRKTNDKMSTPIELDFVGNGATTMNRLPAVDKFSYFFKILQYLMNIILSDNDRNLTADLFLKLEGCIKRNKDADSNDTKQDDCFLLEKSTIMKPQEEVCRIDGEINDISRALSLSENKCKESEHLWEMVLQENKKLQRELSSLESSILNELKEQIINMFNEFENTIDSYKNYKELKNVLLLKTVDDHILNLSFPILPSSIQEKFVKILNKLIDKSVAEENKYNNLCSRLSHLNNHTMEIEKETCGIKNKVETLENQIHTEVVTKISRLEDCLVFSENQNKHFKERLNETNDRLNEFLTELTKSRDKVDYLQSKLDKCTSENLNLSNELNQLNSFVSNIQNKLVCILKEFENVIDTWDSNTNLKDLFSVLQENKIIVGFSDIIMDCNIQTIFFNVLNKLKIKVSQHDEKTINIYKFTHKLMDDIVNLENENSKIKTDFMNLGSVVRGELTNRIIALETSQNVENILITDKFKHTGRNNSLVISQETTEKEPVNFNVEINENNKLQKEIKNFNKAIRADDGSVDKYNYVLEEIDKLVDSLDSCEKVQVLSFMQDEKYNSEGHSSKYQTILCSIINKLQKKLTPIKDKSDSSFQENISRNIKHLENENKIFKENKSEEQNHTCDSCVTLQNVKKKMAFEITSLYVDEDDVSLLHKTLEEVYSKLMHVILMKENEMSCILQKQYKADVDNLELNIEQLTNKIKSQESWIEELESDNEKMNTDICNLNELNNKNQLKLKEFSNEVNKKSEEISSLEKKILELSVENSSLVDELENAKELNQTYQKHIISLENEIKKLGEELIVKTKIVTDFENKYPISSSFKEDRLDNEINSSLPIRSQGNTCGEIHNMKKLCLKCNAVMDNSKTKLVDDLYDSSDIQTMLDENFEFYLSKYMEKEEATLKDTLADNGNILSETLYKSSDSLRFSKNIVRVIAGKIMELETCNINDLKIMQNDLECKSKNLRDLELSVSQLHEELIPNKMSLETKFFNEHFKHDCVITLKNELDMIKEDCFQISDRVEEFNLLAKAGQDIIKNLKNEFQIIKRENFKMYEIIDHLQKSIMNEQEKQVENKQEKEKLAQKISILENKNSQLQNQIRNLLLEIVRSKEEFFLELDIMFPDKLGNKEKINFLNTVFKQYAQDKIYFENMAEDFRFFSSQFELMLFYIGNIEYRLYIALQQKDNLQKELTQVKEQLYIANSQQFEMNRFVNLLVSKSPLPISSPNHAIEVINRIFSEYKLLKENETKLFNEYKLKQEKISDQQRELNSLSKSNSSLQFELSKCEECIRNLRSELRTVRSQCHRRESNAFSIGESKQDILEVAVQTDDLCCRKFRGKIAKQQEKIDFLSKKLTANEIQAQRTSAPSVLYEKQISCLEQALSEAKGRIGRLKFELSQVENNNQELIKSLNIHEQCQEKLDKAYDEIEKLKKMTNELQMK